MSANWLFKQQEESDVLAELLELEQKWQAQFSAAEVEQQMQLLVEDIDARLERNQPIQSQVYQLIDILLDEVSFSGPGMQALPESSLSNVSFTIMYRTGNELTLSLVYSQIMQRLGINGYVSNTPEGVGLIVKISSSELLLVEPSSGASEYLISNDDVKSSLVSDIASYAKPMDNDELVKMILTEQKLTLIEEGLFQQALACVETLMEILPDDPYERRDRGLVLNQLNCGSWAKDDFDYFVKACPNDPMAMFLRTQIEEQLQMVETIH